MGERSAPRRAKERLSLPPTPAFSSSTFHDSPKMESLLAGYNRSHFRESGNVLLVESGILGFGIRNTAQEIRNPTNDWNTGSKFNRQRLESSTLNSESTAWNPESTTVLDTLMWGEHKFRPYLHPYMLMPASLVRPCYVYAYTCVPGAEEQARPCSDAVLFLCRT